MVRNGSTPRQGFRARAWLSNARMWSSVFNSCERLVRKPDLQSSAIVRIKQSIGERRRVPRFGVDGGGGVPPGLLVGGGLQSLRQQKQQQKKLAKAGDGTRVSERQEQFAQVVEKPKPVIMAAGKRIPMIKFPNRRAGETQGTKAVGRASGGGGSQAMPSLPSGKASSQPPRTKLSNAEIEAVLLGAVIEEPDKKKPAPKK